MFDHGYKRLYKATSNVQDFSKKNNFILSSTKFWIGLLVVLGTSLYLIDFVEFKSVHKYISDAVKGKEMHKVFDANSSFRGYLVNTPGCRIPDMDPFDETIRNYIFYPTSVNCTNSKPEPLFESNLTSLYMNVSLLSRYGVENPRELFCCYTEFVRVDPLDLKSDGSVVYSDSCIEIFDTPIKIEKEFIRVTCTRYYDQKTIYEDFVSFVPTRGNGSFKNPSIVKPNVLILGLDAISRINMHRQLPRTYTYLSNHLDAVEILGYNKVADNTFPNLIPVLTGLYEKELAASCWPESHMHFDQCPFIWKRFKEAGYVTALGEDCSHIGVFNYLKTGFKKQPSDYYYTTFDWEAQNQIGFNKDFNCFQCLGRKMVFEVTLNYIDKFLRTMSTQPSSYFAFFWSNSLSHDYLNRPALGDELLYHFFSKLNEEGHLQNTVIIFMSDHGIRWGKIRATYQGQLEERLPYLIISVPKQFRKQFPDAWQNLKTNVRRLTTPFDLHETFKDVLDVSRLTQARKATNKTGTRGYSLLDRIPVTRTCQDAEIESHWCTCQESQHISINDSNVKAAAQFAVDFINLQLRGYAQCARLKLDSLQRARVMTYQSEHITDQKSFKDYILTFTTLPGNATFEVTVRSKKSSGSHTSAFGSAISSNFSVIGTVSRINSYGKQSSCITDFHLKLYCYCVGILEI